MTKTKTPDFSSFEKYMFGALAGRLASSEESSRFAPNALELLAGSKGLNLGKEAEGFVKGTYASKEGIQTAIGIYGGMFEKERGQYSPADLTEWYMPLLSDLEKEEKEKIVEILGKHAESTQEINKRYLKAVRVVKDSEDENLKELHDKKKVSESKEILEKYREIMSTLRVLDEYKFENLRPDVIDEARKKDLKNLASKL